VITNSGLWYGKHAIEDYFLIKVGTCTTDRDFPCPIQIDESHKTAVLEWIAFGLARFS
jgi:hypothetical protein